MARRRPRKRQHGAETTPNDGATTGHEAELWPMADALRGSMDAAEYKHVVLGLIFLKYISDAFEERHATVLAKWGTEAAEDRDEYTAENIFWVPPAARWAHLKAQARQVDRRPDRRRRHGRDRARQPRARGRASAGLRPALARQAASRPVDRSRQQHPGRRRRRPFRLVRIFRETVQPLLDRVVGNIHESRNLSALRDTLLPNLMVGRLRVRKAETFDHRAF